MRGFQIVNLGVVSPFQTLVQAKLLTIVELVIGINVG